MNFCWKKDFVVLNQGFVKFILVLRMFAEHVVSIGNNTSAGVACWRLKTECIILSHCQVKYALLWCTSSIDKKRQVKRKFKIGLQFKGFQNLMSPTKTWKKFFHDVDEESLLSTGLNDKGWQKILVQFFIFYRLFSIKSFSSLFFFDFTTWVLTFLAWHIRVPSMILT